MRLPNSENIRIVYSDKSIGDDLIYKLMRIEEDAYAPEYRGEFDSIAKRFHKVKDMFVLAYDKDKVIGYLCFFPISDKLHDEIINADGFHDDDILPEDVETWKDCNHVYLLSIALFKDYHKQGIGKLMMNAFFDRMREKNSGGQRVEDIVASVVTSAGEGIVEKYGFDKIKCSVDGAFKVYSLNGDML